LGEYTTGSDILLGPTAGDFRMTPSKPWGRQHEEMNRSVYICHRRTPVDPDKPETVKVLPIEIN